MAPALSLRAQIAEAEIDAADMLIDGTPEQHKSALDRLAALEAQRDATPVRIARASSLSDARAELTASHIRAGVDSCFTRALETSARREARAKRHADWLDRVSAQMARDAAFVRRDPKGFIRSLRGC